MVDFRKIKTKYVLNKLKETDDKDLIENLMKIENYIEKNSYKIFFSMNRYNTKSFNTERYLFDFLNFENLKKNYNQDYLEILREMKPQEYVNRDLLTEVDKKIEEKEKELEQLRKERKEKESELTWEIMKKMEE